ncbi:MAG: hypothetical protein Q8K97_12390 [Pseudohongiella sp.]|nr:hypothetical protein [Pseudohongiella sp.]
MSVTDLNATKDFIDSLEEAALGYMTRHQAEHLREQDLFDRAVEHLQISMQTKQATAEKVVARAYGRLRSAESHRHLDVKNSTSQMAILVDDRTGKNYAVPISLIFSALVNDHRRQQSH